MTRKVKDVPISAEGRDQGKTFRLTEMPASQAEKLAYKAFLSLAKAGVEVQDVHLQLGFVGLACWGLQSLVGLPYTDAAELMDEMFACITIVPNKADLNFQRVLKEEDIEEVATRFFLRGEVIQLHVNFSLSDVLSKLPSSRATTSDSSATPTSQPTSEQSSPPAKPPSTN